MTIRLNGRDHSVPLQTTLATLLESLGFEGRPVVVELDEEAIFPRDFPSRVLSDGARVEIVALAAGG